MIYLVHQYLSASARKYPEAIAVVCDKDSLTYTELDAHSNRVARELRMAGMSRNAFVPFFLKKGVNAISAMFGISKADGAYIPLDTDSPGSRIASIINAAGATLVLVDDHTADAFEELRKAEAIDVAILNVDHLKTTDSTPVPSENISVDVAYVLFTSGSTGTPKGVMISHQMIIDYIEWCIDTYEINQSDHIANHAPLYFDNSTFDIYTAMSTGAELHLVHDALNKIMPKLISWVQSHQISVFFCVPSVLSILKRTKKVDAERLGSLRHVIAAGEVLPPDVADYWITQLPDAQLTNMYGPTEITVDCTFHVLHKNVGGGAVPIGRARENMEVFIRLEDGSLSKDDGAEGEIAVRGLSVSYGYLNAPERTAEAFVQNPRHALYKDPIYLTGDLARIEGGVFHYIGRADSQVKHMGNRIELGEIEAALRHIDGVIEAVAVFNDGPSLDEKFIGALVVLEGIEMAEVTEKMRSLVPAYMLPKRVISVDELPCTPNGKKDRKRALTMINQD
jgi:amino acid adenylation domain-containing protein